MLIDISTSNIAKQAFSNLLELKSLYVLYYLRFWLVELELGVNPLQKIKSEISAP